MAKQSQKFKDKNTEILHVNINKYTQILRSRRTRCTRGDVRIYFCTYKTYFYAQNEISYEYIQILF